MSLTVLRTRRYGSRLPVHALPLRSLAVALALTLVTACAKGANRPVAPLDRLHFPAWAAVQPDGKLLVVNDDQDLAFQGGSIVTLDPSTDTIGAGVALPYMAGKVHVVDAAAAAGCDFFTRQPTPDDASVGFPFGRDGQSFAMVPGHSEKSLHFAALPLGGEVARFDVDVPGAADPFDAALTCGGADGKARAWVTYQRGLDEKGYVGQLDLSDKYPPEVVPVFVGNGEPRSFAWDAANDRLYFTNREHKLKAPLRWIDIGQGCKKFPDGVQDEALGGCHVDEVGYDLSAHTAGAEPNAIALSGVVQPCSTLAYEGFQCRRMYLSVRMYDWDLARALDRRPAGDLGGKLVVLELPEGGLGAPAPQWVADYDIGKIAGDVLVIPGAGGKDLVVTTAIDDDLVWIYDDAQGAMVKVFGRLASGVPELGHMPSGLASVDQGGGTVRVYVTSYKDNWVSALDIPLANPADATVVKVPDPIHPTQTIPLRLGSTP